MVQFRSWLDSGCVATQLALCLSTGLRRVSASLAESSYARCRQSSPSHDGKEQRRIAPQTPKRGVAAFDASETGLRNTTAQATVRSRHSDQEKDVTGIRRSVEEAEEACRHDGKHKSCPAHSKKQYTEPQGTTVPASSTSRQEDNEADTESLSTGSSAAGSSNAGTPSTNSSSTGLTGADSSGVNSPSFVSPSSDSSSSDSSSIGSSDTGSGSTSPSSNGTSNFGSSSSASPSPESKTSTSNDPVSTSNQPDTTSLNGGNGSSASDNNTLSSPLPLPPPTNTNPFGSLPSFQNTTSPLPASSSTLPSIASGSNNSIASNQTTNINVQNGNPASQQSSGTSSKTKAIAAGVTVPVALVALGLVAFIIFYRRRQRRKSTSSALPREVEDEEQGNPFSTEQPTPATELSELPRTSIHQVEDTSERQQSGPDISTEASASSTPFHTAPSTLLAPVAAAGGRVSADLLRGKSLKRKPVPALAAEEPFELGQMRDTVALHAVISSVSNQAAGQH